MTLESRPSLSPMMEWPWPPAPGTPQLKCGVNRWLLSLPILDPPRCLSIKVDNFENIVYL